MARITFGLVAGLVVVGGAAFVACGNNSSNTFDDGTGGGDGGTNDEQPIFSTDGGGDGGNSVHCSADLHSVLDQNNTVVQTCPADQGCGPSGCEPACASASDNQSSIGCDYYAVAPDAIPEAQGGCFAAFIANTWGVPITITADYAGQPINVAEATAIPSGSGGGLTYSKMPNNQLPPGKIGILFLAQSANIACPGGFTPGLASDPAAHGTMIGSAFHIKTSAPVVAYDIYPYGGSASFAASATLLLPSTSWGTNYVAVAPFGKDVIVGSAQPSLEIVAQEDGTTVTISPTAAIQAGSGVAGTGKGQPATYNLSKGQLLQFTQDDELTGSPIQSNKPIGVWGAATCLNIDVGDTACDVAHQEIPPVKALGYEYVAVRYRDRDPNASPNESVPWRFVGAVNNTALTYLPSPPNGAPISIGLGKLAQLWAPGPFVVKSQDAQHPFYVSGHMTGQDHPPAAGTGDPEFVNLIAPQEFLPSYVFMTDPTYANTNLIVVRKDTGQGFSDVKLDCMSAPIGGWATIGGSSYQYARVDISKDGSGANGCDNGLHTITSNVPFGLTVWGWDQYVSYAYPAGASVQPINTVIVPAQPF